MIHVHDLVYDYPGHRALHGVSLHIAPGTVTALVGPNGAGKSTLLRCMAGLDAPLAGRITVAGIDVLDDPRRAHTRLGYLSDFFGLYDSLTVMQCLRHAAAAQGIAAADEVARATCTAEALGLGDKLGALAGQLSRGQRQRVAIGQAIVHQPQVLLLDEPASGLDPEAREHLAALFRALRAQGMTLVVSSHILSELDAYCTHLLALRDGRVTQHESLGRAGAELPDDGRAASLERFGIEWAAAVPGLAERLAQVLAALPFAVQVEPGMAPADAGTAGTAGTVGTVGTAGGDSAPTWLRLPPGNRAARALLLQQLVAAGLPVSAFAPAPARLTDRYAVGLATVAPLPAAPEGAAP